MSTLTETGLLAVWDAGRGHDAVRRALVLACAAGADPASVAELSVGQREELVLALREQCFGTTFESVITCPSCRQELELELTIDDVRAARPDGARSVRAAGFDLAFRLITSADLLAVGATADPRRALLRRVVVDATVDVDELPADVLDALVGALSTQDPQADVRVHLDCVACGHEWTSPFDVADHLWAELDAYARRLIYDVHVLACAYGWSEADVLAVDPGRRQCYLDLVAG
jgi:hypothetical protein